MRVAQYFERVPVLMPDDTMALPSHVDAAAPRDALFMRC